MIDKTFVEAIAELEKKAHAPNVKINGLEYSAETLKVINKPSPEVLTTHTLQSILDYLEASDMKGDKVFIHIFSPTCVSLFSHLNSIKQRFEYVRAVFDLSQFKFSQWIPVEQFIIDLQACFMDSLDRAQILAVVGNLRAEQSHVAADDGLSQNVTVQKSAASVGSEKVPNPVGLSPYRTFPEIDPQPESKFICRLKHDETSGFCLKLIPADGDGWKLEAIGLIEKWLEGNGVKQVQDGVVILA